MKRIRTHVPVGPPGFGPEEIQVLTASFSLKIPPHPSGYGRVEGSKAHIAFSIHANVWI